MKSRAARRPNRAQYPPHLFLRSVQQLQTVTRQIIEQCPQGVQPSAQTGHRVFARLLCQVLGRTREQPHPIHITVGSRRNQTRLRDHQVLRGCFSARQNRSDKPAHRVREPARDWTHGQNPKQHSQPRQDAEQPKPLSFDCPLKVHAVFCLSFESTRAKRTKSEQMSIEKLRKQIRRTTKREQRCGGKCIFAQQKSLRAKEKADTRLLFAQKIFR